MNGSVFLGYAKRLESQLVLVHWARLEPSVCDTHLHRKRGENVWHAECTVFTLSVGHAEVTTCCGRNLQDQKQITNNIFFKCSSAALRRRFEPHLSPHFGLSAIGICAAFSPDRRAVSVLCSC